MSSFPVPVGPEIKTFEGNGATQLISSWIRRTQSETPTNGWWMPSEFLSSVSGMWSLQVGRDRFVVVPLNIHRSQRKGHRSQQKWQTEKRAATHPEFHCWRVTIKVENCRHERWRGKVVLEDILGILPNRNSHLSYARRLSGQEQLTEARHLHSQQVF